MKSMINKVLSFILFKNSAEVFELALCNWIFLSIYYDENVKSGANLRFENISSHLHDSNVKIVCFSDLYRSNMLVIRPFWNTKYKRQVAGLLIQFLLKELTLHFDHFPLVSMKNHYYLIHDVGSFYPGVRRSGRVRASLFKYFIRRQKDIIAVSETTKSNLVDLGLCADRIFVSYNSTPYLDRISENYDYKYDCCIITSGAKHKKDELLLAALVALNASICLISSNKSFLKEYDEAINITTIYKASEEVKASALDESKYYITLSQFEGFGITVLEALCCNCICLVSNLLVFRELFGNSNNVYFVDSNDNLISQLKCVVSETRVFQEEDLMFRTWEAIAAELDGFFQDV